MRYKIIGILLLPILIWGQTPAILTDYQPTLTRVEAEYKAGDRFLAEAKLDSALAAYLRARTGINDLFFILINAKRKDSLSAEYLTQHWDEVLAKMQVKLDSLADCEFDRCLIYREEKAANWCIQILQTKNSKAQIQLLTRLIKFMNRDAKSQLKNFFNKIKSWIELELSWQHFQRLQNPEKNPVNTLETTYQQYLEAYTRYRDLIS